MTKPCEKQLPASATEYSLEQTQYTFTQLKSAHEKTILNPYTCARRSSLPQTVSHTNSARGAIATRTQTKSKTCISFVWLCFTCAVATMRVTALIFTSDPTSSFVSGPVAAAASNVETVVIDTDSATSPFAIRVTKFDAVPPDRRGGVKDREKGVAASRSLIVSPTVQIFVTLIVYDMLIVLW